MLTRTFDITAADFLDGTGWDIRPQGACKAERLGMAIVTDEPSGLTAIGPESIGDRALATAQAPELVLGDLDGNEFRLSSLLGQKVVIVSWAPY